MRVFDCIPFANEVDLLRIRLETLAPFVDQFVIIESKQSIAGGPKPLNFNPDQYKTWRDRIRYIVVDLPAGDSPQDVALREQSMRNQIMYGLADLADDDVVIVSDADEIISPEAIQAYRPDLGIAAPDQRLCYYWLNCEADHRWAGTRVATGAILKQNGPDYLRRYGWQGSPILAPGNGGWHFSFLGGVRGIQWKLKNYLHQELNVPHYLDPVWISVAISAGLDLFRRDTTYRFFPVDDLPEVVRKNRGRFAPLIRDGAFWNERWIGQTQLCQLCDTVRSRSLNVPGLVLELGCWEGLSAVVLANSIYPDRLVAVDTWTGSPDSKIPPTSRDILGQFRRNMALLTAGNFEAIRMDHVKFLASLVDVGEVVRFAHVDGSHHYKDVVEQLKLLQRLVPPGGTICGDDFASASRWRDDLDGGVERAVREVVPAGELEVLGNFWIWSRPCVSG